MATTLLPKAKIGIKKKIISADSLKPSSKPEKPIAIGGSKKSSTGEVLIAIKDFLSARYKRGVSSFIMKRRQRQEEKRKLREANIEKKEKKISLPSFKAPAPISNIFDSIGNFLLFMAGGVLFNKFFDIQKSFDGIAKILEVIGKGVEIFANIVGGFTNFIDSAVKGYDDTLKKIEDITGFDKKKIEKFMEDFKYVINGAIIAAVITVRALPLFVSRFLRNRLRNAKKPPKTPKVTTGHDTKLSRMRGGSNTGIDYRKGYSPSGQRLRSGPSISRYNNSMAKYLKGIADAGDIARLTRRGFFKPFKMFSSPLLKKIPIIGFLIDFLVNYFIFKEPLGKSAFVAASAGLGTLIGGALGSLIPVPGVGTAIGGFLGTTTGDWAGRALYDALFGDKDPSADLSLIQESAEYDQITEINNIYLQPIE